MSLCSDCFICSCRYSPCCYLFGCEALCDLCCYINKDYYYQFTWELLNHSWLKDQWRQRWHPGGWSERAALPPSLVSTAGVPLSKVSNPRTDTVVMCRCVSLCECGSECSCKEQTFSFSHFTCLLSPPITAPQRCCAYGVKGHLNDNVYFRKYLLQTGHTRSMQNWTK